MLRTLCRSTLERNQLSGPIPDEWAFSGGFQQLVEFDVSLASCAGLGVKSSPWPFPAKCDWGLLTRAGGPAVHAHAAPSPPGVQLSNNLLSGSFPAVAYTNTSFFLMQSL